MNAAEHLFLTKGFLETTVSEIVSQADVAKGTFYHYFKSKDEILEALRERYMTWYLGKIDDALKEKVDSQAMLSQWCESSVQYYVEKDVFMTCYFMKVFIRVATYMNSGQFHK